MYNIQDLPAQIRRAREARQYTQLFMAVKLNISQNAYSKFELGQSKLTLMRFLAIAEILEMDINKLLNLGPAAPSPVKASLSAA